jgi:hypothetical protein
MSWKQDWPITDKIPALYFIYPVWVILFEVEESAFRGSL